MAMKNGKKNDEAFDPNGNYTGRYMRDENVLLTQPEQDADDL